MPTAPAPSQRLLGASALLVLLLSACAPAIEPATAPATPQASRSASSPVASPTVRPEVAPVPRLPDAARTPDEAGAVAFTQHFGDLLLHAEDSGDIAPLAALGTDDCTSCDEMVRHEAEKYVPGNRREGGELHVRGTAPLPSPDGQRRLAVFVTHDATLVVVRRGSVITARSIDAAEWVVRLLWTDDGWRMTAVNHAA